ncbi:hypothetical protein FOZ60_011023 [Perkinsus olseni]|uniref:Reverse transcriptase domain-containing protein n=1 Tax=Perkinsus olseni TaxID=32597 RepID=A0A7J6NDZ9_PEROL|nr:hypothetical protein FOZ60_011023 [Perkinsus olseni]
MSKLASVAASTAGQIGRLLDLDPSRAVCGSPLRPHIISGLLKALGYDEEAKALLEELDLGFSMGDVSSIPESQLWPKAKRNPQLDVRRVFDNYQSATDKEEVLLKIINQEVNSNRMRPFDPSNGPGDCVFTPMALIPKGVDENSTDPKKYRIVEDYKRSKINEGVHLNQTLLLPKLSDLRLLLSKVIHDDASDQSICFFVVDIESAYRQVGVKSEEQLKLNVRVGARCFRHLRLPFGHRASGYNFSRVAGAVHRIVLSLLPLVGLNCHGLLYVDDTLFVCREKSAVPSMCFVLLTWSLCGLFPSYRKLQLNTSAKFIGFNLESSGQNVSVTVPTSKIDNLISDISEMLSKKSVSLDWLAKVGGKLIWAFQSYRYLKSHLSSLFGCKSMMERKKLKVIRTPHKLRRDLTSLGGHLNDIRRAGLVFNIAPICHNLSSPKNACIVSDASTKAIAGTLYFESKWSYWTLRINSLPLEVREKILKVPACASANDICQLELLAVLISLALLAQRDKAPMIWVLCDNMGVVHILNKNLQRPRPTRLATTAGGPILAQVRPQPGSILHQLEAELPG